MPGITKLIAIYQGAILLNILKMLYPFAKSCKTSMFSIVDNKNSILVAQYNGHLLILLFVHGLSP